jgi:hypothetical protein
VWSSEQDVVLFADRARQRVPAIVDDLMDRQWREVPEFFVTDDPEYRDAVRASTLENVELMISALRRPRAMPRALPPGPRLEADVAAQHGAELHALLRTYLLGQQAMVEHVIDDLHRAGAHQPGDAMRTATRIIHEYMQAVMPLVAGEYGAELLRLQARPDLRRLRAVEAVLAGDDGAQLDYPVRGEHVALVTRAPHAERAIADAAASLGVAHLAVRAAGGQCWAWVATTDVAELRARLTGGTGWRALDAPVGVGGPGAFRLSHRQAHLAERVARTPGELVELRAVALEALVLGDQRTAWEVARAELGPLAGPDPRAVRLRGTLDAWFRSRERLSEAAATLEVAPRTVTYRLRAAEALLGHPIAHRRAELEAALRVQQLFAHRPPAGA